MPDIHVSDGSGDAAVVRCREGQPLYAALLAANVPPSGVFLTADGDPVSAFHRAERDRRYEATLLERYDLAGVREMYEPGDGPTRSYADRRVTFDEGLRDGREERTLDGVVSSVERTLAEVIDHYDLITAGSDVLVPLSGGADSAALLLGLDAVADRLPEFEVTALTVESYWTEERSPDVERAVELAEEVGVDHEVVPTTAVTARYGLSVPVTDAFAELAATYPDRAVAVANGVNRCVFERHAASNAMDAVLLGDHATDLLAGLLNSLATGVRSDVGDLPSESVGGVTYAYPLAFLTKHELALYRYARTGGRVTHDAFDPWEYNPPMQSFCYFLADLVQWYWPGAQYWLLTGDRDAGERTATDAACANCGKRASESDLTGAGVCEVCRLFDELGYLAD